MIRFLDGPAMGQTLMLKSAPEFLRVTCAARELVPKWDALDQPNDTPQPYETITVYERIGDSHLVHVRMSGKGSGFYRTGEYQLLRPEPPADVVRDNARWREWLTGKFGPSV